MIFHPIKRSVLRSTARGFTLVELIMVIMLVGILSAVAVPVFINYSTDAKDAVTRKKLKELREAITGNPTLISGGVYTKAGFENDLGALPTSLDDLAAIGAYAAYNPFTKIGWRGPYVNTTDANWKKDGWGTDIVYNSGARTLKSCGPNATCGNGDDITVSF